ncbi:MAG TPA: hypothetical protein PKV84_01200 [Candidatus Omnitrophota bacterium]|nr:hypothetical protein [Candidatus Omnitrophota bacterium]
MKIFAVILEVLPKSVEILAGAGLFVLPVSKTAAETCFIAALVCWLLLKIASKTPLFPRSAPAFFFLLFLAATLFSLIQIPPSLFPTGLKGALRWLKYLGIFCMCWDIYRSSGQRSRLFWIFLISTAVVAFDGFWQLYTGKDLFFGRPLDPGRIVRIKASLPGPTDLASFLLFAIPLSALFFFRAVSKKLRATAGFLFFFFLAAFFLTFSRAAFYALAASLLLNLFSMKKAKAAVLLSVSLAMLVFAVPSFRYNFVERLSARTSRSPKGGLTGTWRSR